MNPDPLAVSDGRGQQDGPEVDRSPGPRPDRQPGVELPHHRLHPRLERDERGRNVRGGTPCADPIITS